MRHFLVCVSAAALAVAGCERGSTQPGDKAADQVEPAQVSREALRAAVSDDQVRAFYEARGWRAAWNEDQAGALTEALRDAPRHGMDVAAFLRDSDAARSPAEREATLTLAAISYAGALANGRVNPDQTFEIYTLRTPDPEIGAGLNQAVERGKVGAWLASLPPQDAEYRALSEAFLRYSRQMGGNAQAIAPGDAIEAGDRDPRVPRLVEALRSNGYLQGEMPADQPGDLYRPQMAEAVQRLQQDYGLTADGIVGADTLEVLNAGAADRARTLAINLERRRWLERDAPETRIDVNTAATFLTYWRGGDAVDTRRVVVGQPGWETPQLGSPIYRLVANPNWTVPMSIAEEEIFPQGPGYLRANDMYVNDDGFVVQRPGPDSALGLVKFDMQNDHAIYLHDTPAKALFQQNERHSSHGCVRVQDAMGFARMLAEHGGVSAEFARAMATGDETFVPLPQNIPVRMLYHTAYLDGGQITFRTDPYGWDEEVARALGMEARERQAVRTHVSVTGP